MQFVFQDLLGNIRKGCLILIPLLLLIKTATSLIKGFTSDLRVHYQGLFSAILLWLFVACYPEIINQLDKVCQAIISFVAPPLGNPIQEVNQAMFARKVLENANQTEEFNKAIKEIGNGHVLNGSGHVISTLSGTFIKSVKDTGEDFIGGLLAIFASIARMIIEIVRAILLKFLIAVGPIAISFSISDGFTHVARYWLQKLVSVYCWALTLNILDHIVIDYYTQVALYPAVTGNAPETPYFMDQLIVGGMYMMVPWLTSSFLGGTNAGQFLSQQVRVLSTLASTVTSAGKSIIAGKNR